MRAEDSEQMTLLNWATVARGKYKELKLLYHVPNERKCSPQHGAMLKRLGVRSGVPDLCLPVARGLYHGLYIEMKSKSKSARLSDNQKEWIAMLNDQGYFATVCFGWEQAAKAIEDYLNIK